MSVSGFGDLRRLVAAAMAGVGLKRKATIVLRGKVERRGKADKGEAAATEYKARGCAAEPSRTTCDDRFRG